MKPKVFLLIALSMTACAVTAGLPPTYYLSPAEAYSSQLVQELAEASEDGNVDKIKNLVEGGADVNARGARGINPLFFALREQEYEAFVALLQLGADPNQHWESGTTIMHLAAKFGDHRYLSAAIEYGGDINVKNSIDSKTPLFDATTPQAKESVDFLLGVGADPNVQDGQGYTPLMQAAMYRQYDVVYKMLVRGADWTIRARNGTSLGGFMKTDRRVGGTEAFLSDFQRVEEFIEEHGGDFSGSD